MTHYGRPAAENNPKSPSPQILHTAAGRILALGCAMIAGFFLTTILPAEEVEKTAFPERKMPAEGVTAVMQMTVPEREMLAVQTGEENTAGTGAEPFGYLDGTWNLWEYIGDLMWSLLS